MIKRRFFKVDHGDRDASDASSSSSDDDLQAEAESSEEESEELAVAEVKPNDAEAASASSGYASEDSSANDVDVNSAGLLFSEDDAGAISERQVLINRELLSKCDTENKILTNVLDEKKSLPTDMSSHVLQCKSVFKCRICPRIICLSEDTLRDHLQSKRHARSEKLLNEGRLKAMLNSDGEIENQEISEIQTKDTEDEVETEKNHKGPRQQKKRLKKKVKNTGIENQEISEIQTKDTEDDAETEKNHEGPRQQKKRLRKKISDKANARKMLSSKDPGKRRRKK